MINMIKNFFFTLIFMIFLNILLCSATIYDGEIYPGQKGHAVTEISGGIKETLNFEVVGVLEEGSLGQSYVLIRLYGDIIEKYGVAAGMSGSPVYINGMLLGAISYTFAFQRENLAGVTLISDTIKQCRNISSLEFFKIDNFEIRSLNETLIFSNTLTNEKRNKLPVGGLQNIDLFDKENSMPFLFEPVYVPGLGSGAKDLKFDKEQELLPGDTLGMLLMKGDMNVTAFGTVTYVDKLKNIAYGLGHAAFSLGYYQIPITKANTVYTVPSKNISFKIAENVNIVGTMVADSNAGIKIDLNEEPDFVSLAINLISGPDTKEFNFDIARFNPAIPSMFQNACFSSILNYLGTYSIRSIDACINFLGDNDLNIKFRNIYNGGSSFPMMITEVSNLIAILLFNEFKEFPLNSIKANILVRNEIERFSFINCTISSNKLIQGEEVDINMLLTSNKGNTIIKNTSIMIPEFFPDSRGMIIIANNSYFTAFEMMRNQQRFSPGSFNDIVRLINEYPSSNNIYIMLYAFSPSYSIDGKELKNLPIFYDRLMSLDQSLVNKNNFSLEDLVIIETDHAISGGKVFPVEIFYK